MKASANSHLRRAALSVAAAAVFTLGWAGIAAAAACLETASAISTNCTANDFAVSSISVLNIDSNDCGGVTDSFTFDGEFNVESGSTDRYDVGFYVSTDSNQALTGNNCSVHTIPQDAGSPADDGDFCGDYEGLAITVPVSNVTVKCADNDGDGFFDLALCTGWDQNGGNQCDNASEAIAGTPAKCDCQFVNSNVEIPECDTNAECTDDDGNICTTNVCLGLGEPGADSFGCGDANNTLPCPDAVFCNGTDVCAAGSCGHSGDPCAGNGECNDNCNEADEDCVEPQGEACTSDGNACTDDECDGNGACANTNNTDPCTDDGQICTNDVCAGGICTHPDNNGGPCDDGEFCTVDDICEGGECDGDPRDCTDVHVCTADVCDEANNECDHTADNSQCDDQDECTQDICSLIDGCISNDVCGELICRSPGYWSTHSGVEKPKQTSVNVTQELLDIVNGIEVCGQTITSTVNADSPFLEGLGLDSALEGLCVRTRGVQERQLYRQLVAAALNCAASGSDGVCDEALSQVMDVSFDDCSAVCAGDVIVDPPSVGDCIHELDCFNNGGQIVSGDCAFGNCETQTEIFCGGDFEGCPDLPDGPDDGDEPDPQPCIDFPLNCHAAPLCNEPLGFCPKKTPASSSAACKEAKFNECTIDECAP